MIKIVEEIKSIGVSVETKKQTEKSRPEVLNGSTMKISPANSNSVFITINKDSNGRPVEFLFNTKNAVLNTPLQLLARMLAAIARTEDPKFIIQELCETQDNNPYFLNKKYYTSVYQHIGLTIMEHLYPGDPIEEPPEICIDCE